LEVIAECLDEGGTSGEDSLSDDWINEEVKLLSFYARKTCKYKILAVLLQYHPILVFICSLFFSPIARVNFFTPLLNVCEL